MRPARRQERSTKKKDTLRPKHKGQLLPLRGKAKRKRFCTFDIESKKDNTQLAGFTRPFLVGFYDGKMFRSWRNDTPWAPSHIDSPDFEWEHLATNPGGCVDRFLRFYLTSEYAGTVLYAHNGGNFDFLHLLRWLNEHRDEFSFVIIPVQSTIQKLVITRENADGSVDKWELLDSVKILPMSLDKAAKSFDLGGKLAHDLNMHELDERWEAYLEVDCVKLFGVMTKTHDLVENKLGGEVGITAPSTSMKLFRRYMRKPIERNCHFAECKDPECQNCLHQWIRRGYYGGRTEIFELEGRGLRYYDLNSSYVAAMREAMPVGEAQEKWGFIDWKLREAHVGFAEVLVEIPDDCPIPPLPFRAKSGKLLFPTGRFRGVWDVDELRLLEEKIVGGRILEVGRVVWYPAERVFLQMVQDLYRLRDKGRADYDEGLSLLAKLLGNSLYGKFGMDPAKEEICYPQQSDDPGKCFLCGKKSGKALCKGCQGSKPANEDPDSQVWYRARHVDAPYIIPQISAHITTLARIRLWRVLQEVLAKGGRILYSDTDSVLTDVELATSNALGALKDEYPGELLKGIFLQPKVYMLEKEKVFSGEHDAFDNVGHCIKGESCKGCSRVKIAAKGLPKLQRTAENMKKLLRGAKAFEKLRELETKFNEGYVSERKYRRDRKSLEQTAENDGTVVFDRLEKIRSLARVGFTRAPRMSTVKKRLVSVYDKREVIAGGKTRAHWVDEAPQYGLEGLGVGMDDGRLEDMYLEAAAE